MKLILRSLNRFRALSQKNPNTTNHASLIILLRALSLIPRETSSIRDSQKSVFQIPCISACSRILI